MPKFNEAAWKNSEKELSNEAKTILGLKETKYKKYSPSYSFALPEIDFKSNKSLFKIKIYMLSYLIFSMIFLLFLLSTLFLTPFDIGKLVQTIFHNPGVYTNLTLWNTIAFIPAVGDQEKKFIFGITPFFLIALIFILLLILGTVVFIYIKKKYAFDETCFFLYCIFSRTNIILVISVLLLFSLQSSIPYTDFDKNTNITIIKSIFFSATIDISGALTNCNLNSIGLIIYSIIFSLIISSFIILVIKYIYDIKKTFREFRQANIIEKSKKSDLYEI